MVGDHFKDVQLGVNAGIPAVLVLTGHGRLQWEEAGPATRRLPAHVAPDLAAALAEKEKELAMIQKDIDEKLARIEELQKNVEARLDELNAVPDKEFRNLIKVYSSMRASKVAPLLDKMSVDEAVKILRAMKTDAVAKIIPKLEPNKAVAVSKKLGMITVD